VEPSAQLQLRVFPEAMVSPKWLVTMVTIEHARARPTKTVATATTTTAQQQKQQHSKLHTTMVACEACGGASLCHAGLTSSTMQAAVAAAVTSDRERG